jgi:hypothetical protein
MLIHILMRGRTSADALKEFVGLGDAPELQQALFVCGPFKFH